MLSPPQPDPRHQRAQRVLAEDLPHQLVLLLNIRPHNYWFWTVAGQPGRLIMNPRRLIDLPFNPDVLDPTARALHEYWTDQARYIQGLQLDRLLVRQIII